MDSNRIRAVEGYLQAEFTGASVELVRDVSGRRSRTILFRVDDGPNDYRLELSEEFLEDRAPEEITRELIDRKTSDYLRAHNAPTVVLLVEDGFLLR